MESLLAELELEKTFPVFAKCPRTVAAVIAGMLDMSDVHPLVGNDGSGVRLTQTFLLSS